MTEEKTEPIRNEETAMVLASDNEKTTADLVPVMLPEKTTADLAPVRVEEEKPEEKSSTPEAPTVQPIEEPKKAAPESAERPAPTERPKRPARLETALTSIVLVIAVSVATWMFARPKTLLFPPTKEAPEQLGQSPDCRRVRFDVEQLLGERWRQTIALCLRGSCDTLREALLARNFPVSSWQLLEDGEDTEQGCEVSVSGAAKSPECTRLAGRIEGVAKTVLLQVEGECREKP